MSRLTRFAAVSFALALTATACSSDSKDSDATTVGTAAATTTDAAAATTEAAVTTDGPVSTDAVETIPPTDDTMVADTVVDTVVEDTVPTTEAAAAGSLIDVITAAGNYTTLLVAIETAGLTDDVATGKYTLLAPTDEAFAALGQPAIDALLADPVALTATLQNHLLPLPQKLSSIAIFNGVVTVSGDSLAVVETDDVVTIGGATVVAPDLIADNGIAQGIDMVLIPAPAA